MDPLLILAIGIACVLGLILVLRVNAFLALITSAIVVSVLAPGDWGIKMSRVAEAFGSSAGSIAIVIALAAIIGECMMASGAADRIVQAFLSLLGQKRASWALMGSGFVLAVPVFFDTVFYLLVPLARSLYRKTGKNYLLYILAIAAGGAITHTLVPPTPGPLIMASTLGIDVGVMILVGGLVALPAAVAGLATARFFDSRMNIPFREAGLGDAAPAGPPVNAAGDEVALPPLWLSLLPVVLPVLLISTNTALSTMANNERLAQLKLEHVQDWDALRSRLTATDDPVGQRIAATLAAKGIDVSTLGENWDNETQQQVLAGLNKILVSKTPLLYDHAAFDSVVEKRWKIDADIAADADATDADLAGLKRQQLLDTLLQASLMNLQPHELERTNRTLLEVALPGVIERHEWSSPLRKAADISGFFGNANFALLLSTVAAMYLLYRQKSVTLAELSQTVEASLMSGGTIILITAAGGAFGAMLKVAKIGDSIRDAFAGSGGSGMVFLLLGYGIAALMKVAQGSSTTAMIVVSGMLAAMITNPEALGYHPVYLATAIGAGSL
ncbi:MAG: hypothetical protein KDA96_12255, partial [Planctomycetaceae bacterium]|nr:hypothetical protein [Planctomycetaceae bacterium]